MSTQARASCGGRAPRLSAGEYSMISARSLATLAVGVGVIACEGAAPTGQPGPSAPTTDGGQPTQDADAASHVEALDQMAGAEGDAMDAWFGPLAEAGDGATDVPTAIL